MRVFSNADNMIRQMEENKHQYSVDLGKMHERTIKYLLDSGLIEDESDIERYAVRNLANRYDGDVLSEIKSIVDLKHRLDSNIKNMNK